MCCQSSLVCFVDGNKSTSTDKSPFDYRVKTVISYFFVIDSTYVSESCSEWAPHQPVYDGIDAGVETAEEGEPKQ